MNFKRDSFKYLSYKCIVPGCITNREGNDNYTTLFHFPQDSFLLEKWKSQMPFVNFHDIDFSSSLLCELHFEAHHVIQASINSRKMLAMDAYPTIFGTNCYPQPEFQPVPTPSSMQQYQYYHHYNPPPAAPPQEQQPPPEPVVQTTVGCRFCLKTISSEEMIEIDREIRNQFEDITNTELKMSAFYSSVSCINCCRDLRKCSSIKYKLVKNQEKLYEMINPKDTADNISSDGNAFTDFQMEMDGKVEVKIEVTEDMVKIKEEPGTTIAAWQHDPLEENTFDKINRGGARYNQNGERMFLLFFL